MKLIEAWLSVCVCVCVSVCLAESRLMGVTGPRGHGWPNAVVSLANAAVTLSARVFLRNKRPSAQTRRSEISCGEGLTGQCLKSWKRCVHFLFRGMSALTADISKEECVFLPPIPSPTQSHTPAVSVSEVFHCAVLPPDMLSDCFCFVLIDTAVVHFFRK